MIQLAKRALTGTRWEEPAKRLYSALTRHRNSLYDWQTIAIMRRVLHESSSCIDAGAFEGGMLRHMVRLAPRGRHLAFEPTPDKYEALVGAFPTVQVYPFALGDSPSSARFYHMRDHPALSGLRRRLDDLPSERVEILSVTVESLDRVVPPEMMVSFIKVDVEGGELGVFRGGASTIRRCRPTIVFECGRGGANHFGTGPDEVFGFFQDVRLGVSLLGDRLANRAPLSRSAFIEQYETGANFYFVAHS